MKLFTGCQYLMIDAASHFGLDKITFEERIEWCKTNLNQLESLLPFAKKPDLFLKTIYAIRDTQNGIPTGHLVEFDAVASGIQLMSALMGCKTGAMNTGLIDPDVMPDAYSTLTERMKTHLGYSVDVSRDDAKQSMMTYFYGSENKPKEIFGDGTPEYSAFFKAAQETAPEAYDLRNILLNSWQAGALEHSWVMPDGFHVVIKNMVAKDTVIKVPELNSSFTHRFLENEGSDKGLSIPANAIHSIDSMVVREMNRRCNYDIDDVVKASDLIASYKRITVFPATAVIDRTKFVSLNLINGLTYTKLKKMDFSTITRLENLIFNVLNQSKPFELVCIHDAFKAHANNMNTVRYWYKEILAELADSHLMQDIIQQIHKDTSITLTRASEDLGDLIRNSNYGIA